MSGSDAHRKNLLLPEQKRWTAEDGPVLELDNVSIGFDGNQVLDGLSLKIMPEETTVIVGRSGSGKSVLLKLMMGLLQPDSGTVKLFGRDLAQVSPVEILEMRKRMGMLFQNYALFDALSVEENFGFTLLENTDMQRPDIMELAHKLVDVMGLTGSEKLLPSELSGGMKKRVSLGRALISNPEIVLFDEPTTGLDPIMIEKVDEMILMAKREYQITQVIISHDMASTKRLADHVAFLSDGKIVFYGSHDEFYESKVPAVASFVEGARTSRLSIEDSHVVSDYEAERQLVDAPVVELVELHKHFGPKHVLKGVNLKIPGHKITVLIGASGSGKSVIIKHIMGLFKPDSGQIKVFGKDIVPMNDLELNETRGRFGLLFQHAALLDWLSVRGNVAFPLQERTDKPRAEIEDMVDDILEQLNIVDIGNSMPGEVSEGQKKRVGLARAIIMRPEIMIYDEPTTGQDPIRTRAIDDMIQETQEKFDITSIVISHDMASTFRIAHTIALLNQGKIAAFGTPAEIMASEDAHTKEFIHAGAVE